MIKNLKRALEKRETTGAGRKAVALLIFGTIILVFAFFGVNQDQLGMPGGGVVGQVNHKTISLAQFRHRLQMVEDQYRQFGAGMNMDTLRQFLQQQVLESLIEAEVIHQRAQEIGVVVTKSEVRETLIKLPVFQNEGRFSRQYYETYLQATNQSAADFEAQIFRQLEKEKLGRLMTRSGQPLLQEAAWLESLQQAKMGFSYVRLNKKELFLSWEKESKANLPSDLVGGEWGKRISEYYEKNRAEFTEKEQVRARHILFKAADEKEFAEAKKKMAKVTETLTKSNFAAVASKISQDEGSKKQGGDLGYFIRGRMVKEFEDQAFALKPGEMSAPIQSSFGVHLILVEDHKPEVSKSLEQARPQIAAQLQREDAWQSLKVQLEGALTGQNLKQLDQLLATHKLSWSKVTEASLGSGLLPEVGGTEEDFLQVLGLPSEAPVLPKFIQGKDQFFIVRKEGDISLGLANSSKSPALENRGGDMARRLVEKWKTEAQIQRQLPM